jgi:hypothetical protein
MPEKLAVAVAGVMTVVLGIWARIKFVRRSEVFDRTGKPMFQYASECKELQKECHASYCGKIDDLKKGQVDVQKEIKKISEVVIRLDERMAK